jgi:hypothetical protein
VEVFNWANLIVATTVPFVSAYVAYWLSRADAFKRSVQETLIGVNRHVQEYIYDFMALRRTIEVGWTIAGFLPDHPDQKREQDEYARIKHEQSMQLISRVTALECDCLTLGLLLDDRSDALGRLLRQLSSRSHLLLESPESQALPSTEECFNGLQRENATIGQASRELWESQFKRRWWSPLRKVESTPTVVAKDRR